MKTVTYFFVLLFLWCTALPAFAQTHTPRYISMSSKTKGYYEYLPEGYDSTGTATYPLILFMTGIGEFGNGSATQLPAVNKNGLTKLIQAGAFPKSFTVGGQVFRFIVITPQFIKFPRPEAADVDSVLDYIIAHYKVDINRIYITGLSYGGGMCWAYSGANDKYSKRVAAIVPIASPVPDGADSTIYARSRVIAANNVAVWATHNQRDQDDTVATTIAYVNDINQPPAPTPPAKMTIFNAGGHDAWTKTYSPTYKENGLNVYEWMLQYYRNIAPPNQAPQANAGADQVITLPTSSITLNGSGIDADGSVSAYNWTKISGPVSGSIATPTAASTTVSALVEGTYVFRLTVTDNKGAVATDDVTVTVNAAPNVAPQANAGPDQTITLPVASVTLNGSGTDSDGTIATYSWTKVSGPNGGSITTPGAATTTVTGLAEGIYTFRLTVTDNKGATGSDDILVTVNAAPNVAPQANAGPDQTITLPTNNVALNGLGTDSDGTVATYTWTKVSGPAAGNITTPNAAATNVTGLVQGTYVFRLTVTDNKGATAMDDVTVVVNAAPNVIPQANAGPDQTITLPVSEVTLTGSGTDSDGTISSYTWTKVSGPAGEIITNPTAATTNVTALQQGVYIFRLTVTDNKGATASDDVNITVDAGAPENKVPVANAGADQTLTLPENSVTLTGTGTDSDGSIAQYAWSKISGPDGSSITTPGNATTTITGLTEGTYTFRLTVTDNAGSIAFDDVSITVNAAPNKPPVANAGTDITITLPVNTITLSGSGSDPDGTIAYYGWTKVSGPSDGTITDSYAAATTVTGLVQGSYTFRLTVTDNKGATASDDVVVTVNPAPNRAPQVYAGDDQTIVLPANSVSLSGDAIDADGTIASYSWTKVSGPDGSTIALPGNSKTEVSGLTPGIYVFRLTVTDNNGATAFDDVTVTVQTAPNKAPQADAGADQQITLPVSSITLHGAGTDSDGIIVSYDWIKISGPAGGTLSTPTVDSTLVTDLQQGTYVFQLTVTDNNGAVATDEVSIDVRVVTGIDDDPTRAGYKLQVAPNPTTTHFSIKLVSPSARPAYIRVTDALGRVVEERTNVQRNSTITIGQQYRPGVYHAEVIQDGKRIVAPLLKMQ